VEPNNMPVRSNFDTGRVFSMPKGRTAATAMDVLTHAIPGYLNWRGQAPVRHACHAGDGATPLPRHNYPVV
jgi:alcohol dehydrogenase class IV